MENKYLLDTSIIITDPHCLESFPQADIFIHIDTLNELDKLKTLPNFAGKQARLFIRHLDALSDANDISKGLSLDNGSIFKIDYNNYNTDKFGSPKYADNKILACAEAHKEGLIFVSNDINLKLRAKAMGIPSISHERYKKNTDELFTGVCEIKSEKYAKELKARKLIPCTGKLKNLLPNECVIFKGPNNKVLAIGRKINDNIKLIGGFNPWGLKSANIEQAMAIDLLLDPEVPLVTLAGVAGTGKSLIAVASGLESVCTLKQYEKLIVYRPIQPVGTDMGYLPGDLNEKLDPWMSAIKDSLDFLASQSKKTKKNGWNNTMNQFNGQIHFEALTYIRGRSIPNTFIVVDECQNISKEEIKTILTRTGYNTKIVLTGDLEQIDNSNLDAVNNGLSYVTECFKSSELAGHVTLHRGERSPLATLAAKLL